jgi:acetoin utilization protein AcuB
MKIKDWMNSPVHTVKPQDTVAHARALLERYRINQLPMVVDGVVAGMVTDRDLRDAAPAAAEQAAADIEGVKVPGLDLTQIGVEYVMSDKVLSLGPEDDLTDAVRIMRRERFGALPIVAATAWRAF